MPGPASAAMVRAVPTPMAGMAARPAPIIPRGACAVALSPAAMPREAGRRASGAGPPEAASAAPPSGPPSSGPGPSIASAVRAPQVPVRRVSGSKRSSACPARTGARRARCPAARPRSAPRPP